MNSNSNTKNLVISAVGKDRPGIVHDISKAVLDAGCNIEDSRMSVLGGEFALIVLLSGTWSAVAKFESQIQPLAKKLDLAISAKYTEARAVRTDMVPYQVDVVAMDHPGIVHDIADFFASRGINIEELTTWTYPAAHTGTPMFSLSMTVSIPARVQIAKLREDFMTFCDAQNIDATLEPSRH